MVSRPINAEKLHCRMCRKSPSRPPRNGIMVGLEECNRFFELQGSNTKISTPRNGLMILTSSTEPCLFSFWTNYWWTTNWQTRSWYDIMLSKKQYANMPNQVLMDKQKISQKPLVFFWAYFSPSNLVDFSIQPGGFLHGWCINVTGRCVALKLVAHSPYGSSVWTWELGD